MVEDRIPVFGKDVEQRDKRAFDLTVANGQCVVETKDRTGHKVRTPLDKVLACSEQLKKKQKPNLTA